MESGTIRIRGRVQGVGFRPFVWRLAQEFGIRGTVANDGEGVIIQAVGADLEPFARALQEHAPPLSEIHAVETGPLLDTASFEGFTITQSSSGDVRTGVTPDAVVCADCLEEVETPEERRFGYAFANCTNCGPRFSIVQQIPYDRATTTMAPFEMCADCRREYENPADRRFHAQPIACPKCGPKAWLEWGDEIEEIDPLGLAAQRLKAGDILAIKGIGGFHLAVDATNDAAVQRLRTRKQRPAKPFALMASDVAVIERYCIVNQDERDALAGPAAPIVLLALRQDKARALLAESVAPHQWTLGWMLPTSPLHHLLMKAVGRPLVMTSGNLSGEPQVIGNQEAREKLSRFVDGYLLHDREIARRLDDSVVRLSRGDLLVQRRARGLAPGTFDLGDAFGALPSVTAYGAFMKSSLCLLNGREALLSHHLGDLSDALTVEEFRKADADYAELMDHRPHAIICDQHPDYPSTHHARHRADEANLPLMAVQHHHAHIAAVMAENGWHPNQGPVLGVALDGLGWGEDDTIWGGEFLLASYTEMTRLAHLKPVPLPGGGAAQSEPWRNLLSQLDQADLTDVADDWLSDKPLATLRQAVLKGINSPLTSSAGRLFDAMAAAVGASPDRQSFEGEAAMALEGLARRALDAEGAYPFEIQQNQLDPTPLWQAVVRDQQAGVPPEVMAMRFHRGLARAACGLALRLARASGAKAIALSGGCFQNMTLLELCLDELSETQLLTHKQTPTNDGGVALGQAIIGACSLAK